MTSHSGQDPRAEPVVAGVRAAPAGFGVGRSAPTFRNVRQSDVEACLEVFYTAAEELHSRTGEPVMPRNPAPLERLFHHFVGTDPALSWLAEVDGRAVAFGIAHQREDHWFLGFLFVLPEWQSRGLGRAVLERCLPPASQRDRVRVSVFVEAIQPVSTGLYAGYGMAPRVPVYVLTGAPRPGSLPDLPTGIVPTPHGQLAGAAGDDGPWLGHMAAFDRMLVGYTRPTEHQLWLATGRRGFLYGLSGGDPVAYGYVQDSGRVGPVGVTDPALLPAVLGHLFRSAQPSGAWQVIVPGPAETAMVPLIRAGFRIDGSPAVYSSSWPGPLFEQYLPMNFALL